MKMVDGKIAMMGTGDQLKLVESLSDLKIGEGLSLGQMFPGLDDDLRGELVALVGGPAGNVGWALKLHAMGVWIGNVVFTVLAAGHVLGVTYEELP